MKNEKISIIIKISLILGKTKSKKKPLHLAKSWFTIY